jgi:hypothetical protein
MVLILASSWVISAHVSSRIGQRAGGILLSGSRTRMSAAASFEHDSSWLMLGEEMFKLGF